MKIDNLPIYEEDSSLDILDPSVVIKRYKKRSSNKESSSYIVYVRIFIKNLKDNSVIKSMQDCFPSFELAGVRIIDASNGGKIYEVLFRKSFLKSIKGLQDVVNFSVIANTYLKNYFLKKELIDEYEINSTIGKRDNDLDTYNHLYEINYYASADEVYDNKLHLQGQLIKLTDASNDIGIISNNEALYEFDYTYGNLSKNLEKIIKEENE